MVHVDRNRKFNGLKNVTVLENDHDCIEITYFNNDKLYVPVENIELLSKHEIVNSHKLITKVQLVI